jgi:hypothetical protein
MIRRAEAESESGPVTLLERTRRQGHAPFLAVLAGASIAAAETVERMLFDAGWSVCVMRDTRPDVASIKFALQAGLGVMVLTQDPVYARIVAEIPSARLIVETIENEELTGLRKISQKLQE